MKEVLGYTGTTPVPRGVEVMVERNEVPAAASERSARHFPKAT
jgi:hypothetical protein